MVRDQILTSSEIDSSGLQLYVQIHDQYIVFTEGL